MSDTLWTGLNPYFPLSACKVPSGEQFFASGVDVPLRYDGVGDTAEYAGMYPPLTAPTLAAGGAGSQTGTYYGYVRFIDDEGIPSNLSPISVAATITSKYLSWSNIPVDTRPNPRTVARQLFRNTTGQTDVFYLVATINDNVTTTYPTDNIADSSLANNTALRILAPDGSINANRFGVPPAKAVVQAHGNHTFWAVDPVYDEGHLVLTHGDATVTGVGTHFTEAMIGRALYIPGEPTVYFIDDVTSATELELTVVYDGTSDLFSPYAIKAVKEERNRIYYSYPGEPESVPELSNDLVQQSGQEEDEPTGLMSLASMLFILMERTCYRWTFQIRPDEDGAIYPNHTRGCLNQRTWCQVDGMAYLLDRQGIYGFNGGAPDPVSRDIQDLFRPGGINWRQAKWFSAAGYPADATVKFFVCLDGSYRPRHALCFNYRTNSWWVEAYPWYVTSSGQTRIDDQIKLILGSEQEQIFLAECDEASDGPTALVTGRATVDSSTPLSVTASGLVFTATDLKLAPISIVAGRGAGQTRRIMSADAATGKITIDRPWLILPDETSVVQLAGIEWQYRTGRILLQNDSERETGIVFRPTVRDGSITLRNYLNQLDEPEINEVSLPEGGAHSPGTSCEAKTPDVRINVKSQRDLGKSNGHEWWCWANPNQQPRYPVDRFASVELSGVTNQEPVTIHSVSVLGGQQPGSVP